MPTPPESVDADPARQGSLVLRIDPRRLTNPDADLRYEIPDLLVDRSDGRLQSDGYDYEDDNTMVIFIGTTDVAWAEPFVRQVLATEAVLGNTLDGRYELSIEQLPREGSGDNA